MLVLLGIFFLDYLQDLVLVFSFSEKFPEIFVLEHAGYPGKRLKVRARRFFRGYQEKKYVDRFTVERIEIDPFP